MLSLREETALIRSLKSGAKQISWRTVSGWLRNLRSGLYFSTIWMVSIILLASNLFGMFFPVIVHGIDAHSQLVSDFLENPCRMSRNISFPPGWIIVRSGETVHHWKHLSVFCSPPSVWFFPIGGGRNPLLHDYPGFTISVCFYDLRRLTLIYCCRAFNIRNWNIAGSHFFLPVGSE